MEVDVSPDMQFYNLLESYPYTIKGALSEYIDNALESFKTAKNNGVDGLPDILTIDIDINADSIIIKDDGTGISLADIQRAMKPAYTPLQQSLSEFGIGMKAASLWFGKKWILESFSVFDNSSYQIVFDLEVLLNQKSHTVDTTPIPRAPKTGVKIVLSKLNRNIDFKQAERTWEELQETYQLFTSRDNPILKINFKFIEKSLPHKDFSKLIVANVPLNFPICQFRDGVLYAVGRSKTWKQDIEFEFEGKKVKGFISLGAESSQTSNPGVRLFRFGRLIKGMEVKPYRPVDLVGTPNKAAPSRFYAELHLDGQAVSNSKGEFIFDEYQFIEMLKAQSGVLDFIEQAEHYRSKKHEIDDYIKLKNWSEYEDKTGVKHDESIPLQKKKKTKTARKVEPAKPEPINILKKVSAPDTFMLLDTFIEAAVDLYSAQKFWPFCLVYRVVLEVSIIDKIKILDDDCYATAKDKSIVALYKYLQSNTQLIPDSYETLKRVLRETNKDKDPFVGILNLASHGRYMPTKQEVDDLLKNTQQLVEWAFDREI